MVVITSLIGGFIVFSNRLVKVETQSNHQLLAITEEKAERKESEAKILQAAHDDRKVFQSHQKETTAALHELSKAIVGLQVFLESNLSKAKPGRKAKNDE